jgi:hypothetical protein
MSNLYTTLIVIVTFLPLNLLLIGLILYLQSKSKVKTLKESKLSEHLSKVLLDFKDQIKVTYLSDGRIKLSFPIKIMDNNIEFYLSENVDGTIDISDHADVVSRIDMNKTPNKNAVRKACSVFGASYIPVVKSIEITTVSRDKLDEAIWQMLATILVIEYVRY